MGGIHSSSESLEVMVDGAIPYFSI
jgi:hypothetical protein